jgi:hypothetical protein
MVDNTFSEGDDDIKRRIRDLVMRTDILVRRYGTCSINVKLAIFKTYCVSYYDAGLWRYYSATVFNKLRSCYNKFVKSFFVIFGGIV